MSWFDKAVGRSFDQYARHWSKQRYRMHVGDDKGRELVDDSKDHLLNRPGDEWGEQVRLATVYRDLVPRLIGSDPIVVLEIGSGAGRLTEVMKNEFDGLIQKYYALDVSREMTRILRQRMAGWKKLKTHVVKDVDLSMFPDRHFDLCLSQSAWSHINFYDQYRYLRDLRRVMKQNAPLACFGICFMGVKSDWHWQLFCKRVYQIEHGIKGVYHEFIGQSQFAEMALRLGWEIDRLKPNNFVLRNRSADVTDSIRDGALIPPCPFL